VGWIEAHAGPTGFIGIEYKRTSVAFWGQLMAANV